MTKRELGIHIDTMLDITSKAKQYAYDSFNLIMLDSSVKDMIVRHDKFLNKTRSAFWTLAIIETHKLFGGGYDYFRFENLFKLLRSNYPNSEWKHNISLDEITHIESIFSSNEMKSKIKELKELRNQHYAHLDQDPNNHIMNIRLFYKDLEELFAISEKVCINLKEKLFNTQCSKVMLDKNSINQLIDKLVDYNRMKGMESIKSIKS